MQQQWNKHWLFSPFYKALADTAIRPTAPLSYEGISLKSVICEIKEWDLTMM